MMLIQYYSLLQIATIEYGVVCGKIPNYAGSPRFDLQLLSSGGDPTFSIDPHQQKQLDIIQIRC